MDNIKLTNEWERYMMSYFDKCKEIADLREEMSRIEHMRDKTVIDSNYRLQRLQSKLEMIEADRDYLRKCANF